MSNANAKPNLTPRQAELLEQCEQEWERAKEIARRHSESTDPDEQARLAGDYRKSLLESRIRWDYYVAECESQS